ncbi:MAG: Re/Si-specific NAD(P)(+) transhydrogenase subunit alpha, partial [Pseudolysinimonas sp.]
MPIGIIAEGAPGETRVAATPSTVAQLIQLGYEVIVERGAGAGSSFPDAAYVTAGAQLVTRKAAWAAAIVLTVAAPSDAELAMLSKGAVLISWLSPGLNPDLVDKFVALPITALAVDAVPRISRAQSMDVLSSTANIAGYRAIIEAANSFGRFFTGQITAAGKVPPAKVLVAGVGVAGLAAIGAASSLGAIVRATDPRPEVAEQVSSIGGTYLPVEVAEKMDSSDGYAKVTSEAYDKRAAELYSEQARDVDIIVTTANIPGRAAPKLITTEMVKSMRPGSVIVD